MSDSTLYGYRPYAGSLSVPRRLADSHTGSKAPVIVQFLCPPSNLISPSTQTPRLYCHNRQAPSIKTPSVPELSVHQGSPAKLPWIVGRSVEVEKRRGVRSKEGVGAFVAGIKSRSKGKF